MARSAHSWDKTWHLFPNANLKKDTLDFLGQFGSAKFALAGEPLDWVVNLDVPNSGFTLGRIDGDSEDVSTDAIDRQWSPYWHYFGHRYDRGWTRSLQATEKTSVTFHLTQPLNEIFLTANKEPSKIKEKMVTYVLAGGERLTFIDRRAKRDWFALKSYQDVDAIVVEPVNKENAD